MVCEAKGTREAKISRSLHVAFVECIVSPEFSVYFKAACLNVKYFLCSVHSGTVALKIVIVALLTEKSQCRTPSNSQPGML